SSPGVSVFGLDGAGTVTAAPANVANGASGQSVTFTFTAPSGGTSSGEVDIVVPASWTAPTASNAAGCVSSSTGSVSVSGTTIKWTGITLAAAGTATVTYGATSGGACTAGDTATSSGTAGTSTFTTKEMSTPGG